MIVPPSLSASGGAEYEKTRHNAGFWLVNRLARASGVTLSADSKLSGRRAKAAIAGRPVWLFEPDTSMNLSGRAVRRMLDYFKLDTDQVLIVHDEIDLPPGIARFKSGGGHGGHNGLRDVIAHCGRDFLRLRVGVGHPGSKAAVIGYVLRPPRAEEMAEIDASLDASEHAVQLLFERGLEAATLDLHTRLKRATSPSGESDE